ncbi:MAG: 3-oxoacyl-ACP reductase, partial [Burkholderiales bacterium PBB5]
MSSDFPTTPSFRLDGRRALVAGAGRGIGAAAALALAEAGADVVLAARSLAELESVAEAVRARGGRAEVLLLDVTQPVAVAREVKARGPFEVLVNSAGMNRPALITEGSDSDLEDMLALNVKAAF